MSKEAEGVSYCLWMALTAIWLPLICAGIGFYCSGATGIVIGTVLGIVADAILFILTFNTEDTDI